MGLQEQLIASKRFFEGRAMILQEVACFWGPLHQRLDADLKARLRFNRTG